MGSSGPTNSTNTTKMEPPAYIAPYSIQLANRSAALSNRPYQQYTGEQVAPLNDYHNKGMSAVMSRAMTGDKTFNAANQQAANTLSGNYLGKGVFQNQGLGIGNKYLGGIASQQAAKNPQMNNNWVKNVANQYGMQNHLMGVDNKYLDEVINNTNSDIVRTFQNGTLPQTDTSFARAGAFGGSAWQQANAENNRQLANELAKNTSNLRMADYNQQVQLYENLANRKQQADTFNRNLQAGYYQDQQSLAENLAQRQQQADSFNRQSLLNDYFQRQDSAESLAERQTAAWDAERARQMGMVGQGQQLSNQPYTDAQNMLGVGDIYRDYRQTLDNQGYQNFLNKQNWELQNLDVLSNAIRTSMGNGSTSTQTATMPAVNRAASMIGGGMAGAVMGSALGGYGTAGAGLGALAGYFG